MTDSGNFGSYGNAPGVCAGCGQPLADGPVERVTDPGTQMLRAYHLGCVPPMLDEQI